MQRIVIWNWLLLILFFCPGCSQDHSQKVQGYIEGRYTYITTPVSGVLKQLAVERGTQVKAGALLFVLEGQPESDAYQSAVQSVGQSIAAKEAIIANLDYAKITYQRYSVLVPKQAIDRSRLDNARATLLSTEAQLAQAAASIAQQQAELAEAAWRKDQKKQFAPVDALVFDTYYRIGEYTTANQPVLSLLAPSDIKVIFYVRESLLGGLQLGDQILVTCDGCTHAVAGKIRFISPVAEYTPPVIYSNETNAKLIYRLEGSFTPQEAIKLHPGQPVTVKVTPHE